jgi:hypothetical protein
MKVALYSSHHSLPFWHSPENPNIMFDTSYLGNWTYINAGNELDQPAMEHWSIPILLGLQKINIPGLMANVSIFFDKKTRKIIVPKRVWVQITTEPKTFRDDIPLVVEGGNVKVEHIWGGDNKGYWPNDLIDEKDKEKTGNCSFWHDFFLFKLKKVREETIQDAEKKINEAISTIKIFSIIPK